MLVIFKLFMSYCLFVVHRFQYLFDKSVSRFFHFLFLMCVFPVFQVYLMFKFAPYFPLFSKLCFKWFRLFPNLLILQFFLPTNAEPRELPHPPLTNVGDRIFELRGHLFLPHRQGRVGDPFWKR